MRAMGSPAALQRGNHFALGGRYPGWVMALRNTVKVRAWREAEHAFTCVQGRAWRACSTDDKALRFREGECGA